MLGGLLTLAGSIWVYSSFLLGCLVTVQYKGFERFQVMAFSFDPDLAIFSGLFGAILGEPE